MITVLVKVASVRRKRKREDTGKFIYTVWIVYTVTHLLLELTI